MFLTRFTSPLRHTYLSAQLAQIASYLDHLKTVLCLFCFEDSVVSSDIECVCPKPCKQTVYEPALSQAALSFLSVDNILSENIELSKKYHTALEAQQRVKEDIFLNDLQMIDDIHRQYVYLQGFAKKYLGDFQKSKFAKIWAASSTLVGIFDGDIRALLQNLQSHVDAYGLFFEDASNLLTIYIMELDTGFHELSQLLQIRTEDTANNRFLADILDRMNMKVTLANQNFRLFQRRLADRDLLKTGDKDQDELIQYLPERFTAKNNNCYNDIVTLMVYLEDLRKDLEKINTVEYLSRNTTNGTFVYEEIQDHIHWFLKKSAHLQRCLQEYHVALTKTQDWLDATIKLVDNFQDQKPFSGQSFNFTAESHLIEQDEKEVAKIYQRYSIAQISKLHYLRHFDPDEQSSEVTTNINTFVDRIQNRLTEPLRDRIQKIRRDLQKEYENCFEIATNLQRYLPERTFYVAAGAIKIWRIPSPNLENPERYEDTGTEYWKVWNRDMDMEKFTEKDLPRHVAAGLESFCNELLEVLDGFEQQLLLHKQKLLTALERVQEAYDEYIVMRKIEHQFVL